LKISTIMDADMDMDDIVAVSVSTATTTTETTEAAAPPPAPVPPVPVAPVIMPAETEPDSATTTTTPPQTETAVSTEDPVVEEKQPQNTAEEEATKPEGEEPQNTTEEAATKPEGEEAKLQEEENDIAALTENKPISTHEFGYFIPDTTIEYNLKQVFDSWLLDERHLKSCKPRVFRNPGKPYPDYFYKGSELFEAAKDRFGSEDKFIKRLRARAKCFRVDPINTPDIRYVLLRKEEDEVYKIRSMDGVIHAGTTATKMMSLFQESELVVILFASSRGFTTWGVMESMPTPVYKVALNNSTIVSFRDVDRIYDDQGDCFEADIVELPTDLGYAITVTLGERSFDDELREKRKVRRDRSRDRDRDRSRDKRRRSRSRSRDRERRGRTPPEIKLNPNSLNLMNIPAGMSYHDIQKVEASQVIQKRRKQGFYI